MPDNRPPSLPTQAARAARKPAWRSKTLWFNTVCTVLAAVEASLGLLQPLLPVNVYAVIAFTLAVGNPVLRAFTSQGLSLTAR